MCSLSDLMLLFITLGFVSVLKVTCGFSPPITGVAGAPEEEVSLGTLLNFLVLTLDVEPSSDVVSAL